MDNRLLIGIGMAIICAALIIGGLLYVAVDRSVSRTVAAVEALPSQLAEVVSPSTAVTDTAQRLAGLSDLTSATVEATALGATSENAKPPMDCGWLTGSQLVDADSFVREYQENAARVFKEVGEDLVVCGRIHSVSQVESRWVIRLGDKGLFGVWVWGETPDWVADLERGQTASIHCTGYHDLSYGDPPPGTLVHCFALYEPD